MAKRLLTTIPVDESNGCFRRPSKPSTFTTKVTASANLLGALQMEVDGYVEIIGYFKKFNGRAAKAYANEDGVRAGLAVNTAATQLWKEQYTHATTLYGPIVIDQPYKEPAATIAVKVAKKGGRKPSRD